MYVDRHLPFLCSKVSQLWDLILRGERVYQKFEGEYLFPTIAIAIEWSFSYGNTPDTGDAG